MPEITVQLRFVKQGEDRGTVFLAAEPTATGEPLTMVSLSDRQWSLLDRREYVTLTLAGTE